MAHAHPSDPGSPYLPAGLRLPQIPWNRRVRDIILGNMLCHSRSSIEILRARIGRCAGKALLSGALLVSTVAPARAEPAAGTLEISFLFNKAEGVVPSYQIAVWLETQTGEYVKTLFVSDYLSGGGFGLGDVCPDWVKQANWEKAEESEFDAVTRPTPPIGARTLKFDCRQRSIAPGTYRFCVQAHIVEKYNILYRGTIVVGEQGSEAAGEAFYSPAKHPQAADILSDVRAHYVPAEQSTHP
jgi:hypothetical protein